MYYAITGRYHGWDEDGWWTSTSRMTYDEAVAAFRAEMQEIEQASDDKLAQDEANGEGIYINAVFKSESRITP